jgi:hypothetical protein
MAGASNFKPWLAVSQVLRELGVSPTQTRAFIAGISGKTVSGPTQPVLVNAQGQLGTASAAAAKVGRSATGNAVAKVRAQNRRQGNRIAAQQKQIATLEREVARLARR